MAVLLMATTIAVRAEDVQQAAKDSQQPDVALLEYLGEWASSDNNWTDPVDILDMKIDDSKKDDKANVSEKRNGS